MCLCDVTVLLILVISIWIESLFWTFQMDGDYCFHFVVLIKFTEMESYFICCLINSTIKKTVPIIYAYINASELSQNTHKHTNGTDHQSKIGPTNKIRQILVHLLKGLHVNEMHYE